MMVQLLYFAWVREMVGTDSETITLPADITTVAALLDWLAARSPGHAAALADRSRIRIAVDQGFATSATPLNNPREIAIFPPVTGG
ncbi:molybdopterin converting factor subunit 1 [Sandarakinorhabdus limnophila]|uniref:molybdopterin converting factor subunit 1 n=1 Tax=Sandarakinorhabdus limnophila TaxID=210512 RepID=UPI0026F22441|nr:molybdopterin converting factor subunit 1 [Sandarakinorhabdus limnophila]